MTKKNRNRFRSFHSSDGRWTIHQGHVETVVPTLGNPQYDGLLSDAPYGLEFMGHGWDEMVPPVEVWHELLRVCKPGAFLLVFGGTKTFHRLIANIEDAGWEIRDTLCWLYGEGFPKGCNIGKSIRVISPNAEEAKKWDGHATALKPAWEPIVLAQKPRQKSFTENALRHGCGGLNIDSCRIGSNGGTKRSHQSPYPRLAGGTEDRTHWGRSGHSVEQVDKGRWPANLILDEEAAEALDRQSGKTRSRRSNRRTAQSNIGNGRTLNPFRSRLDVVDGYEDEGGASRFFYVAKASRRERKGNPHSTVKPLTLCEYLARLILPPKRRTPRRLLVPFSGSGSEMLGALTAGWEHVTGIEAESKWVSVARRRLSEFGPDTKSA